MDDFMIRIIEFDFNVEILSKTEDEARLAFDEPFGRIISDSIELSENIH